ncbi:hypothetical protein QJS10_CPA16g01757 [Acorus calamus]|uniref:rRNA biogenesis protein RRP36 n=1 Tax=Acorus calamus TaxID=4465 RepID=A0AAV9D3D0_ACOCL|nr:hypothetical protein QJS10_CPA16g01757 [Acorus calamus]
MTDLSEEDERVSSSDEEEEEDLEREIERELAEVPLGELHKARAAGFHSASSSGGGGRRRIPDEEKKTSRVNKNRPMEMSSRKPVGRFRQIIQVPKKKLQKLVKKSKEPEETEKLKKHISWINDGTSLASILTVVSYQDKQLKSESGKSRDAEILAEHKKKEREAAKHGKRPFYLKKSEIREQSLIQKYNNLKAEGKLESFIEKRRKKNASKDHRYMPYRRPANEN